DRGLFQPDQDLVRTRLRDRDFFHPDAAGAFALDQGLHGGGDGGLLELRHGRAVGMGRSPALYRRRVCLPVVTGVICARPRPRPMVAGLSRPSGIPCAPASSPRPSPPPCCPPPPLPPKACGCPRSCRRSKRPCVAPASRAIRPTCPTCRSRR